MNRQQIYDHLADIHRRWNEMSPLELRGVMLYIAGGCIASLINDEVPNDYDFYCYYDSDAEKIHEFYKHDKHRVVCITDNAVTFDNGIQIITGYAGPPTLITSKFDFLHCQNYWQETGLTLDRKAYEVCHIKELVFNPESDKPVATLFRVAKFVSRGWHISKHELLEIAIKLSDMDLSDPDVLNEQLTGYYGNATIGNKDMTLEF